LDKAGRSLYWTLHEAHPRERGRRLLTYWSALIERYVHWLLEQTYQARGRLACSPGFQNGDEAFDAYLLEGSCLIVFEIKASILTAQSKYGFNAAALQDELNRKAVTGADGERKGVAQLYANLVRFLEGDDVSGLDRTAVKTIYPVLVFLDGSFTAPYLNRVYNEHFERDQIRRQYRRRVTPLFSITVEDLENILPHTDRHWLSDVLDSYWHENRNMYGAFSRSRVPLLEGESPGKDVVRERFRRFGNDLQQRLFPNQPAGQTTD
jgi:hypothetical protein